jgi:hypothetical protein
MLEFTPPEMQNNPHSTVDEPQLVWCLGEIARQVSQGKLLTFGFIVKPATAARATIFYKLS